MTHRPDPGRIYSALLCRVTNKPDGSLDVIDRRRVAECRCGSVGDNEHRVSSGHNWWHEPIASELFVFKGRRAVPEFRLPTRTRDDNDSISVRLLRMVNIHEESKTRIHAVNDVL